jgi:hypothetical protein
VQDGDGLGDKVGLALGDGMTGRPDADAVGLLLGCGRRTLAGGVVDGAATGLVVGAEIIEIFELGLGIVRAVVAGRSIVRDCSGRL